MTKSSRALAAISLAGALFCASAWAQSSPQASPPPPNAPDAKSATAQWKGLVDEGASAGLLRARLKSTADRLAKAGVPPETGRAVLSPALEAARQGLPWEPVLARIDEGTLKRVAPDALAAAARARLEALAKAKALLVGALGAPLTRETATLIPPAALALESGLSEAILEGAVRRGRAMPPAQLRAVVEAGEALQLAGFEPEALAGILEDCLARNLRRQEVLRVVRFAVEKKRQGLSGTAVRQALWAPTARGERPPTASEGQAEKPAN